MQFFPEPIHISSQGNNCRFTTSFIQEVTYTQVSCEQIFIGGHCKHDCLINQYMPRKKKNKYYKDADQFFCSCPVQSFIHSIVCIYCQSISVETCKLKSAKLVFHGIVNDTV
uniref:Uncharacterized protein n=1 Tax=Micrurus lemniscatus lemniscatus TaxID=129467 RepID=A0A2D4I9S9_MICLE